MNARMKLTRRNLIVAVAVVAAVGLGAFILLDILFVNHLTPARATGLLEKASPKLVSVLRKDFSDDFSKIIKATVKAEETLTDNNKISHFLDTQTRPITVKLADAARNAPPELVKGWMGSLAAVFDGVQAVAGPELCSQFVKQGQSVLTDPDMLDTLLPLFDARDAALFVALAGARDTPVADSIGDATDQDWEAVGAAMNGLEVPAGYAQIVSSDNVQNRDYCPALAYYFRTIEALPEDAGERIRAEYFVQSIS